MKNEPLSAIEHLKIVIFLPLLIPSYFFGIIPVLFLAFGYYMMKKNSDFSSLEVSVKAVKIYYIVVTIASIIVTLFSLVSYINYGNNWGDHYDELIFTFGAISVISSAYYIALNYLYFIPLKNHSEWVVTNGVFSNKPKTTPQENPKHGINILQSQKMKQYSVADELIKWAKLKEDGHISNDEFEEARSKLLGRS
jgi:hypothetical protein